MITKKHVLIALTALCLLLVGATLTRAAQGPSIIRKVIGGGGAHLEQGNYTLYNTLGQPIVGRYSQSGRSLGVGFWSREIIFHFIYLPLVLRNY